MQDKIRKTIEDNHISLQEKYMKLKIDREYYYAKYLESQDAANYYMNKSEKLEEELAKLRGEK